MDTVYKLKKKAFKAEGRTMNDDKWNPGDIWAFKKGIDPSKELDATSVESLNKTLKAAFDKKLIVPISLKKIGPKKKPSITVHNDQEDSEIPYKFKDILVSSKRGNFWSSRGGNLFADDFKADFRTPYNFAPINFEIVKNGTTWRSLRVWRYPIRSL